MISYLRMRCEKCKINPSHHNFKSLGQLHDGTHVVYSCPAAAIENRLTKESFPDYIAHLEEASQTNWIWIVDCKGIQSKNIPTLEMLKQMCELLQTRYIHKIHAVYFIQMDWQIHMVLNLVQPFLKLATKKKIHTNHTLTSCLLSVSPETAHQLHAHV